MTEPSPYELNRQGDHLFARGEYAAALARFQQAVTLARAQRMPDSELYALNGIACAYNNQGEYARAAETATTLLARARQTEHTESEAWAVLRLAYALAAMDLRGRWPEIRPLLLAGRTTARQLGDTYLEVYHLLRLGEYAVEAGELEAGFGWLQEGLIAITPGMAQEHWFRSSIYQALSDLMRRRGDLAEALRYAELAVGAARQDTMPDLIAWVQLTLAAAERARGERAEALRLVEEEVLPAAQAHGWQSVEQEAEYQRAELTRELGYAERAEAAAQRALALARALHRKEAEVKSLLSLGQALGALGQLAEARVVFTEARRLSQERDYADHFATADHLLKGGLS